MLRSVSRKLYSIHVLNKSATCSIKQKRNLSLLEYQGKELLKNCGVSVQNFGIVDDINKVNSTLDELR